MRYTIVLPLAAALTSAIVIPDDVMAQQLSLGVNTPAEEAENSGSSWWDAIYEGSSLHHVFFDENAHNHLDDIFPDVDASGHVLHTDDDVFNTDRPHRGGRHHGLLNLTVYQAIQASNYTKRFVALVDKFPDIVSLLNTTDSNVTVFVPVDKAFEKLPEQEHKPDKKWLQAFIEYHILPGFYPGGRMMASHTLPTSLTSGALGDRPQRVRASFGLFGLRMNFFSKIIVGNIATKNGMIHGLDNILAPPPSARRFVSLFPTKFSTLELAAEKTGLLPHGDDKHDEHHESLTGLTLFAPTNDAFRKLGPAAMAFLFNTEKGLTYLRALLKYHIVVNQTLYSDAYYGVKDDADMFMETHSDEDAEKSDMDNGHFHVDLPTLLDDKHLSIDISRWYRFIRMRINTYHTVAVQDCLAHNGVVQVVSSVLLPPREPKKDAAWTGVEGWITVEDLVERLQPYIDDDAGNADMGTGGGAAKDWPWGEL
ncbi:FAS1 domain-containing protein [Nemania sp. FL0916]|nr:FAS1 domain-containing protein [Nemania sp. FL0916]